MNPKEKEKILAEFEKRMTEDGVGLDGVHACEVLEQILNTQESEPIIPHPEKECICHPSNLQIGSRWSINPDCQRHNAQPGSELDIQSKLLQLHDDFRATHTEGDEWSQGVKDGIRKAMTVSGLDGWEKFTQKADRRLAGKE